MELKEPPARTADVTFEWQIFQTARGIMVMDGWGSPLGVFKTPGAASIAMLAAEIGPPPRLATYNDNRAA